jgi:hypothetical protein
MKKEKKQKPYWEMTTSELAEATREFDGPIDSSKLRPLSKAERAKWDRARKGPWRSIYVIQSGGPKKAVTLKLDEELIRRSTELAAERNLTLAELVAKSLHGMLLISK